MLINPHSYEAVFKIWPIISVAKEFTHIIVLFLIKENFLGKFGMKIHTSVPIRVFGKKLIYGKIIKGPK